MKLRLPCRVRSAFAGGRYRAVHSADDTIKKLGINLEELKKKTPAEQFRTLGAAISAVQDPSQKAAASMEIFGRSGVALLSLFSSDGFGEAAAQVGSQAQILAKDAALFDDVGDKLALTGMKVRGFWVGVAEKVAPVLKPLLDKFASLDLASWGQKAGERTARERESVSRGAHFA